MSKEPTTPSGAKKKDAYLKIVTTKDDDFFALAHKHGLIDKEMGAAAFFELPASKRQCLMQELIKRGLVISGANEDQKIGGKRVDQRYR